MIWKRKHNDIFYVEFLEVEIHGNVMYHKYLNMNDWIKSSPKIIENFEPVGLTLQEALFIMNL